MLLTFDLTGREAQALRDALAAAMSALEIQRLQAVGVGARQAATALQDHAEALGRLNQKLALKPYNRLGLQPNKNI